MIYHKEDTFPYKFMDFYYIVIIAIMSLGMFLPGIRIGVFASVIIFFLFVTNFRIARSFKSKMDLLVLLYIMYTTLSFLCFIFSNLPVSVFIREYSNSILPILFYYLAKKNEINNINFFNITLSAIILCFVIGFILFIQQPLYYRQYLYSIGGTGGTDILLTSNFFQSLVGLTMTGSLGFVGVVLSLTKILDTKARRGKIALVICIAAVALSFRRSAMVVTLGAFFIYHYIGYIKYSKIKKRFFLLEALLLFFISHYSYSNFGDWILMLSERTFDISNAIEGRSDSWFEGLNYGNLIIGDGLGVYGHKAIEFSDKYVPDGYYFRSIAELGVVGTSVFLFIIIGTLIKGLKTFKANTLEVSIIVGLCLQAIGSNIFSFQLIAPFFWYCVGRINTKK